MERLQRREAENGDAGLGLDLLAVAREFVRHLWVTNRPAPDGQRETDIWYLAAGIARRVPGNG